MSLATLMVLALAWKPFWAWIILTNSVATSALDFSSDPPWIEPAPPVIACVAIASPELAEGT